ncbi:hypothetical protein RM780_03935 [Streptomyces sp. DSM 44917]|uniref:Helix-turn-helix domain-containing protein n=1 Tax=Streptomyces boetiae TaxID=3075541 RepID=A0ABU2L4F0_9ACTN|nr:hypothetical protein [Streptomyces sp. DSM 44917]MDT0306113.1 hypothetical protein [Streptomyces sp. DSM 44917]
MVAFPNPEKLVEIDNRSHLVSIFEAARAAGVRPGTIRVWVHRGKVEALPIPGQELFYLPAILAAAQVPTGRPPKDEDEQQARTASAA